MLENEFNFRFHKAFLYESLFFSLYTCIGSATCYRWILKVPPRVERTIPIKCGNWIFNNPRYPFCSTISSGAYLNLTSSYKNIPHCVRFVTAIPGKKKCTHISLLSIFQSRPLALRNFSINAAARTRDDPVRVRARARRISIYALRMLRERICVHAHGACAKSPSHRSLSRFNLSGSMIDLIRSY